MAVPSLSAAQQPTATIKTLEGAVLVSGRAAAAGDALQAGDTLETQADASVVLELSDGSQILVGGNTTVDMAMLTLEPSGARVSRLKLVWGRIRAILSQDHQKEGSKFDVHTPIAQVGVRFSQPDIEVSYDISPVLTDGVNVEVTVAYAYTVDLIVTNLLTREFKLVEQGHKAIVYGEFIKIVPLASTPKDESKDETEPEEEIEEPPVEEPPIEVKPPLTERRSVFGRTRELIKGAAGGSVPASTGSGSTGSQSSGGSPPVKREQKPETANPPRRGTITIIEQ